MLLMSYQTTNFLPGCRAFFSLCKFAIKLACRTGVFFRVFQVSKRKRDVTLARAPRPLCLKNVKQIAPVLQATIVSVHFKKVLFSSLIEI